MPRQYAGTRVACVYALTDPRTEEIHYVGKSGVSLQRRLNYHIRDAAAGGIGPKAAWIRQLLAEDVLPDLVVLDESRLTLEELNQRERYWIAKLQPPTNLNAGGDGGRVQAADPELYRQRLSAASRARYDRMTAEERAALSSAQGAGQARRHAQKRLPFMGGPESC